MSPLVQSSGRAQPLTRTRSGAATQLLVAHHDPQLGTHLQQPAWGLATAATQQLWRLLGGALSDAVDAPGWLALWDHCLCQGPEFQYHFLAAYLMHFRRGPLLL